MLGNRIIHKSYFIKKSRSILISQFLIIDKKKATPIAFKNVQNQYVPKTPKILRNTCIRNRLKEGEEG